MTDEFVYVAILEDRHVDDAIELFRKPIHALRQCVQWQMEYGDRYKWVEEEIGEWEYYCRAELDDGPKMRIEKQKLR